MAYTKEKCVPLSHGQLERIEAIAAQLAILLVCNHATEIMLLQVVADMMSIRMVNDCV